MENLNICSVQDLLKELKDRREELQRVKDEREQISLQIQQHREEMDRRMLLLLYMDEGLMDALVKLDSVKKEKQKLENQIHQLTSRNPQWHAVSLTDLQRELSAVLQEETGLSLRCGDLRAALQDPETGPEPPEQDRTSADQNQAAVRAARKRAARK
ncbi:uncharacterized protein [Salminus brasiliensis]|uniref:uncharacterized protein n=1 Tax=Salminus brasiliensis TaxID=930266 RepID=UPI003B82E5E9